jgi:hypothetical protein
LCDEIASLKREMSATRAWLLLQGVLGVLPDRVLLRAFIRRLATFSVDENLGWLIRTLSATPASIVAGDEFVEGSAVCLSSLATQSSASAFRRIDLFSASGEGSPMNLRRVFWQGERAVLVVKETSPAIFFFDSAPVLVIEDFNFTTQQAAALLAIGDLPDSQIWLDADALAHSEVLTWPLDSSLAHERFMQWRVVAAAKGVFSQDQIRFRRWQEIRKMHAPQGVTALAERLVIADRVLT